MSAFGDGHIVYRQRHSIFGITNFYSYTLNYKPFMCRGYVFLLTDCSYVSDSLSNPSDHVVVLSATHVDHDFNRHTWIGPSPRETDEWMEEVNAVVLPIFNNWLLVAATMALENVTLD